MMNLNKMMKLCILCLLVVTICILVVTICILQRPVWHAVQYLLGDHDAFKRHTRIAPEVFWQYSLSSDWSVCAN